MVGLGQEVEDPAVLDVVGQGLAALLGGRLGGGRSRVDDEFGKRQRDHGHALADLENDLLLGHGPGGGEDDDEESDEFFLLCHLACSKTRVMPRDWPAYSFGRGPNGFEASIARRAERWDDSTPRQTPM